MERNDVFDNLSSIAGSKHTALVIWDVQNALVNRIFNKDQFMENNKKLIEHAHKADVPVFFTKITPLPLRFESGPRVAARRTTAFGTDPHALDLAINPGENDIIINKNTASIFIGTNFELMMRNAGIKTLVFTGIATEIGVESSVRDALNRGFYCVVAKDAVSSSSEEKHERSLANMETLNFSAGLTMVETSKILDLWK